LGRKEKKKKKKKEDFGRKRSAFSTEGRKERKKSWFQKQHSWRSSIIFWKERSAICQRFSRHYLKPKNPSVCEAALHFCRGGREKGCPTGAIFSFWEKRQGTETEAGSLIYFFWTKKGLEGLLGDWELQKQQRGGLP